MAHTLPHGASGRSGRRLLCAVLAVVVCSALIGSAAYGDSKRDLKRKQHHVHSQVRHAKGELDGSSAKLRSARTKLAAAEKQLAAAKSALAGTRTALAKARAVTNRIRNQLASARKALSAAQAEERRAEAAVVEQRRQIGVTAANNYMSGDPSLLRMSALFSGESIDDISAQLNAASSVSAKQHAALDQLHATELQVRKQRDAAQALARKVAAQEKAAAANLATKRELTQRAVSQKDQVASLVSGRRAAKRSASRARAADQRELKALKRKEDRIKRQILARSRGQRSRTVRDTGGMLFRPVPGYITSPYGWRMHPIYHYWGLHDGDDFHAPCGTPERAAGSGTVISEYYSSVWGHRLYLDLGKINGHNFTVIYNHISRYAVGSGAHVRRGQTVAYAGTTGWSTGCHLHFTVMRDGNAVNPMNYM